MEIMQSHSKPSRTVASAARRARPLAWATFLFVGLAVANWPTHAHAFDDTRPTARQM
jgi:hypothetical protein